MSRQISLLLVIIESRALKQIIMLQADIIQSLLLKNKNYTEYEVISRGKSILIGTGISLETSLLWRWEINFVLLVIKLMCVKSVNQQINFPLLCRLGR